MVEVRVNVVSVLWRWQKELVLVQMEVQDLLLRSLFKDFTETRAVVIDTLLDRLYYKNLL